LRSPQMARVPHRALPLSRGSPSARGRRLEDLPLLQRHPSLLARARGGVDARGCVERRRRASEQAKERFSGPASGPPAALFAGALATCVETSEEGTGSAKSGSFIGASLPQGVSESRGVSES
jgi:hypothetical protein